MSVYEDVLYEAQDGVAHHMEKRAPRFTGR